MDNFSLNDNSVQFLTSGSGMDGNYPNLSCAALSVESGAESKANFPSSVDMAIRVFQTLFGFVVIFVGVFLNSLILFLVYKFKKLRTVSFGIVCQIAVANWVMTVSFGFPIMINHIAGGWILGGTESCVAIGFLFKTLSYLRTLLFLVFSFDRFLMVFVPFTYPKHSMKVVALFSVIVWSFCITFNTTLSVLDCFSYSSDTLYCVIDTTCHQTCRIIFYIFFSPTIVPSILLSVGFYVALFVKGRIILKSDESVGLSKEVLAKQEWRAIKTFSISFLCFVVVTLPPLLLLNLPEWLSPLMLRVAKIIASNSLAVYVMTDSVLITRNADVKEALKHLWNAYGVFRKKVIQGKSTNSSETCGYCNCTIS